MSIIRTAFFSVMGTFIVACTQQAPRTEAPVPPVTVPDETVSAPDEGKHALSLKVAPWKGDFDQMLQRKVIRVLVPYSRTLYFNDKGRERGVTVENVRDFEAYVNRKYRKDKVPITVAVIPTTRDKLIPNLIDGLGDIAAGNITVTPAREELVDFVAPGNTLTLHDEVVVTGPGSPPLRTLDDLSGKTVSVRPVTSYYESIVALNERFAAENKAPIGIQRLPDALEDPDILEMVNAGILGITVVDELEMDLWSQVLPDLEGHRDIAVRKGTKIGWAIRKESPQLAVAIEDFVAQHMVKQGVLAYRLAKYQKNFRQIANPADSDERKRFEATLELFRRYGEQYNFDALMLAAQGFQESRLDQNARSHVGAIGVMQIMPATGNELGVGDISKIEPNIHAGAKYMSRLMENYFPDAHFDRQNRALFAFAAYNAGPGRIRQLRRLAEQRGLDPDQWFNNVEMVAAERIGMETTTYVRNIYKYYASYRLLEEAETSGQRLKKQLATSNP